MAGYFYSLTLEAIIDAMKLVKTRLYLNIVQNLLINPNFTLSLKTERVLFPFYFIHMHGLLRYEGFSDVV